MEKYDRVESFVLGFGKVLPNENTPQIFTPQAFKVSWQRMNRYRSKHRKSATELHGSYPSRNQFCRHHDTLETHVYLTPLVSRYGTHYFLPSADNKLTM